MIMCLESTLDRKHCHGHIVFNSVNWDYRLGASQNVGLGNGAPITDSSRKMIPKLEYAKKETGKGLTRRMETGEKQWKTRSVQILIAQLLRNPTVNFRNNAIHNIDIWEGTS